MTSENQTKKRVVITGAGGYIGAHTCLAFKDAGYEVVGIDRNFSTAQWTTEFCDVAILADFSELQIAGTPLADADGFVHIAGSSLVGPSVTDPAPYYMNNVGNTAKLLARLADANYKGKFIFSSSAAVYGEPIQSSIVETHPTVPISPYGQSKLMAEQVIADCAEAYGFKAAALRYFNACGADPKQRHGQVKGATHLIARLCENVLNGNTTIVNGDDYPTQSGTCVRDYLHVSDIAAAHVDAVEKINKTFDAYNLGTGTGWSIAEVIDHFEKITGKKVPVEYGPRREGDPAVLVANGSKFHTEFGWIPACSRIDTVIATAWEWYQSERYKGAV
jgi:UDP-glucose 4-epimerase